MNVAAEMHFSDREHQHAAARLGMWVFLATELAFFGPLFLGYAYLRLVSPVGLAEASRHTDILIGTLNTAVLLTSSFLMASAVRANEMGARRGATNLLWSVGALGTTFLCLKSFEYYRDWQAHLLPGMTFMFSGRDPHGAELFFYLYFAMTGVHALHLTIGIACVWTLALRLRKAALSHRIVESTGLYWHFVDAVWIFLYPMLYLVQRHS